MLPHMASEKLSKKQSTKTQIKEIRGKKKRIESLQTDKNAANCE
jgi:hypothetical protein